MTESGTVRERLLSVGVLAAAGVILLVVAALVGSGVHRAEQLGVGVLAAVVGAAVVLLHPVWIYRSLAFVLGAVPLATVPGLGTPVVLALAFAAWCAVLTHPVAETRTSTMELSVGVLVVASLASLVMTAAGLRDVTEFLKWLIATSMVFALLRLDRDELRTFGKIFVFGAFAGAAFALGCLFFDRSGAVVNRLSVIGLRSIGYAAGGMPRLTGTYVEPNSAGIFLLIALAVAVALLRGWQRLVIAPVILAALICTQSRSAMLSVVVAVLFLLIFQPMPRRIRGLIAVVLVGGGAAIVSVPFIYARFVGTFKDRGSLDRAASLADFTNTMTGSWWLGKGWGLPEIISDTAAFKSNHVSNSPLLTIYRGGILVGIAFAVILLVGMVIAYRNAYTLPWETAIIGAQFVGFTVVGLQLDFPVVTHAPVTMVWSVLIVFLIANPVTPKPPGGQIATPTLGQHRKTADA